MKVRELINAILEKSGAPHMDYDKTCDHLIIGDPDMEIQKAAVTFMATVDVINEAAAQGVNFIITHEPTWFSGADDNDVSWLTGDPVYAAKKKLIEEKRMAIWRFHDHMHQGSEDGIYRGFDQEFGWAKYRVQMEKSTEMIDNFGAIYELPEQSLADLSAFFKEKSDMQVVQIVGNPDMKVRRVSVLVGGGSLGLGIENMPMLQMRKYHIDVAICGDITEWTLPAYVRDAAQLGMNMGLLVLGHERSEEPGMKHMPEWLEDIAEGTEVVFIDAKEPFEYL